MNYVRSVWTALGVAGVLWTKAALAQTFVIGGQVTDGTNAISLATITAQGQTVSQTFSTTTDLSGNYTLNLSQGTYLVSASRLNTDIRPVGCLLDLVCSTNATVSVGPGLPLQTNVSFSVVYSVGGRVTVGADGLAGVLMSVQSPFRQADLTDFTGAYTLTGLKRGQYIVSASLEGYTFDPANLTVEVPSSTNINFSGYAQFSISGTVLSGTAGFAGVNITLQGPNGPAGAKTDGTGSFVFPDLVHGTYTVTPSLPGYSFSPPSSTVSGPAALSFVVATLSLNGRVTDGTNGTPNVEIQALQGTNVITTRTDDTGRYAFGDLAGTYAIVPVPAGQSFEPARRTLSVGSQTNSIDFLRAPTVNDTLVTTCDDPSLKLALKFGGTVGFDCGGSASVILGGTVTVRTNAILTGGALGATVDGSNTVSLFRVEPGVGFTVQNLSLIDGMAAGTDGTNGTAGEAAFGGAIFNRGGNVTLIASSFSGNQAAGGSGGDGIGTLDDNTLNGGAGGPAYGGAIYNSGGTLLLTNCTFTGNLATGGAGGTGSDAPAFGGSTDGGYGGAGGSAGGSALYNSAQGTVVAVNCTFSGNSVTGSAGGAGGAGNGALGFPGANGSPGSAGGGGIFNDGGVVMISFDTFSSNSVVGAIGLDGSAGRFSSPGSSGSPGSTAGGGGIINRGGTVSVTNSTFYGNTVAGGKGGAGGSGGTSGFGGKGGDGGAGGAGNGGGMFNETGSAILVDVTFSKNIASGGAGGAAGPAGAGTAIAGKPGAAGGANGGALAMIGGSVIVRNTILAYGTPGKNAFGAITDGGNNLSSDATPVFTSTSSRNSIDPLLSNLANNGGPTLTAALSSISPAIDHGNPAVAPSVDQRYLVRSGEGDIGAFEFNAQPPPRMSVRSTGGNVAISWPSAATGYQLQASPSLSPTAWQDVTNSPVIVNSNYVVTNAIGFPNDFYRLVQ